MKKYKAPGAYAHFIPTESAVVKPGQVRTMALVGTGQQNFERTNVAMVRNINGLVDELPDENIIEILSISSKPIGPKPDPTNRFYVGQIESPDKWDYKLENNKLVWNNLEDPESQAKFKKDIGSCDPALLDIVECDFIPGKSYLTQTEKYKITIDYVDRDDLGSYTVTKMSTGEIIGAYPAGKTVRTDIIPGIQLKIEDTFIVDEQKPDQPKSKTRIGDYLYITTECPKSHIAPKLSYKPFNDSITPFMSVVNGGSNYNCTGDGKDVEPDKLPSITNVIKVNKAYTSLKYKLTIYKKGIPYEANSIFDKLSIGVKGCVAGANKELKIDLFDITNVAKPSTKAKQAITTNVTGTTSQSMYDFTDSLQLQNSAIGDVFELTYSYSIKEDPSLNEADIVLHLDVADNTIVATDNLILITDNAISIRQSILQHKVAYHNEIFASLLKDVKIVNRDNVQSGIFKIKIKSLKDNLITIFNKDNVPRDFSIDSNTEFKEAIPGISFNLFSLKDVEGLIEMYKGGDAADMTGSTVIVETIKSVPNPDVPLENAIYYASYKFAKSEKDYEPKIFTEYSEIVKEYGPYYVTASGKVINSLSLAAEIAMNNGANPLVLVQSKGETDAAMIDAISKLDKKVGFIDNINAIVPLTYSKVVGNYLMMHVEECSQSERNMYRMGYLSAVPGEPINKESTIFSPERGSVQCARDINNERIVYVVPGMVMKQIIDANTGFSIDKKLPGYMLATAVCALAMKNDPAEPLTNKTLKGFSTLLNFYTEPEANELASAGCLVLKQEGSNIKIRHGITTHGCIDTLRDIQSNEITLVQVKDYVIDGCRKQVAETYVGGKLKPSIVNDVEYSTSALLTKYIAEDIIISVEGLEVKRDLDDPRQINIRFKIEAIYPLNYIDISFGFSTTIS